MRYVFHTECAMCCVCGVKMAMSAHGRQEATAFLIGHATESGGSKGPDVDF